MEVDESLGGLVGSGQFWLQTLGCPKNQVDSDKLVGMLTADGLSPAPAPEVADLVVVNTCAFIEEARRESIATILDLSAKRKEGSRLVVTGCMAERYGQELARELPEVDLVAGFGAPLESRPVAVSIGRVGSHHDEVPAGGFDLLELPRPPARSPWAYLKVAEGCDRSCGFCAIPSFRGSQRSRSPESLIAEARRLVEGDGVSPGVQEIVLVAQDLASYGLDRDAPRGPSRRAGQLPIVELVKSVSRIAAWTRLLYLYPSRLSSALIDAILETGVPYFDLSLQHVSRSHLARMRRWGDGDRFLDRIQRIRSLSSQATFRSSFIVGYPGETEEDHDELLQFLSATELDWAGFFPFSPEEGTLACSAPDQVPAELAFERLRECSELQDSITAARRDLLVGESLPVLVDRRGQGRTVHEAPEIDGIVHVPERMPVGSIGLLRIVESLGVDLVAEPDLVGASQSRHRSELA
jgi:ribosomal protein S12 methylthiotransferase